MKTNKCQGDLTDIFAKIEALEAFILKKETFIKSKHPKHQNIHIHFEQSHCLQPTTHEFRQVIHVSVSYAFTRSNAFQTTEAFSVAIRRAMSNLKDR